MWTYKVLAATALVLGVAACSSADPSAGRQQVASVVTSSSAATPTTSADAQRPRHRIDESAEDRKRLIDPWDACMKAHGADMDQQPNSSIAAAEAWSAAHADAGKACNSKLPLLPWGEDRANPAYKDNLHNWVRCMTAKGMHVTESPDDPESPWSFASDTQPPNADQIEHDCEVQAMAPSDK